MINLTQETRQKWRNFLSSDAGMFGLAYLRERVPQVRTGKDILPHHVQIDAGIGVGYTRALDDLWTKIAETPNRPQAPEETPTLEDTRSLADPRASETET